MASDSPHDRALRAVTVVLPRTANIEVRRPDTVADLIVNGTPIQVKWVGDGGLRQVRALVPDLRQYR